MSDIAAGWARQEMKIQRGQPMAGYIARQSVSTGNLSPLFVRALVLKQGEFTTGIIVADLLLISNRWAAQLRSLLARVLGTKRERIIVAATHTHSGPLTDARPFNFGAYRGGRRDQRCLMREIGKSMERAMAEAKESLRPVQVSAAHVMIRGVASDRNHPNRSRTQPLFLIRFKGAAGAAMLAVNGCHSTVLGAENTLLSGDLNGAVAQELERKVGVALVATGAAANISTRFTRNDQTPREVCSLAAATAKQISAARFHWLREVKLSERSRWLRLRVANLQRRSADKTRRAAGRREVVREEGLEVRKQLARAPEFASASVVALLIVLRIGRLSVAALPFEIYSDTGGFLWRSVRAIPLCYANGYWGYIASPAAGPEDYETISSPFDRGADSKIRRAVAALCKI